MLKIRVFIGLLVYCVASAATGATTVAVVSADAVASETTVVEAIQNRIEHLMFSTEQEIDGVPLLGSAVISEFYAQQQYQPLWSSAQKILQLKPLAELAYLEGLDPADYPLQTVLSLLVDGQLPGDAADRADLDILATETLLRIGYQLRFGKVNPAGLFPDWNFHRDLIVGQQRKKTIEEVMAAESLVDYFSGWLYRDSMYKQLKQALANYREIEKQGGWVTVPVGDTLRKGDTDPRVAALRQRLGTTGDISAGATGAGTRFDEELHEAVVHFQNRHGLDADGVVGAKSYAALNVPVASRISQLRASLERGRWVMDDVQEIDSEIVLVNIASAETALMHQGAPIWRSRVQVGKTYRQTPVFRGDIQYLVFNPTWTVPPTILRKDILPKLRKSGVDYLQSKHMDLLDRRGKVVDPSGLAFSPARSGNVPYVLRQQPGPWNALGLVKFIFPNPHFVFLHDTPHRELFDRSARDFSSGCVRVERPFELAKQLLGQPQKWNDDTIAELLETRQMRTVHLEKPIPVFILYWTAMADRDGTVRFYPDVYGRDKTLLAALAKPPVLEIASEG